MFSTFALQALASQGITNEPLDLSASGITATNSKTQYHIVTVSPNTGQATTSHGTKDTSITVRETVTKKTETPPRPPREKTPMEAYADMDIDLPELSTSSSSSKETSKDTSKGTGHDASTSSSSGSGAAGILKKMGPPDVAPWKATSPKMVRYPLLMLCVLDQF